MSRTILLMLGVLATSLSVVMLAGCGGDGDVPDIPDELRETPEDTGVQPGRPDAPEVDEM